MVFARILLALFLNELVQFAAALELLELVQRIELLQLAALEEERLLPVLHRLPLVLVPFGAEL